MIGALADAEAHCDAAIACDRRYGLAYYLRSDLRIQSSERNHVDEMEAVITEGRLSAPSEILLRFALGKECEDLELWNRAFAHVEAGCNLQRRSLPRDPVAEIGEVDAVIQAHTRRWIDAAPRGYVDAAPVFVTGLPRTGTTLVERIIASHSAMHSVGETSAFAAEMRRTMAERPGAATSRGSESATWIRPPRSVCRIMSASSTRHWRTTFIAASFMQRCLRRRSSSFNAIRWTRAGRSTRRTSATSSRSHMTKPSLRTTILPIAGSRSAGAACCRRRCSWKSTTRTSFGTRPRRAGTSSGFWGFPGRIASCAFHESPAPSATASAVQVRRPIYASSVGKWRHHAERLEPLRERLAREIPEAELV